MKRAVATFNTGSSSLKFALYEIKGSELGACLLRCNLKDLRGDLSIDITPGNLIRSRELESAIADLEPVPASLIPAILDYLQKTFDHYEIIAIGHRIVHGGRLRTQACASSLDILSELELLSVFAPDHQPHNLSGVKAVSQAHPSILQSLSFDTAFHRTIPEVSQLYAIPKALSDEGLLRFGFHGLSYENIAARVPEILAGRPHSKIIAAHLGSGASLCAMRNGESVATSMGLTALSGIPMAKRCGDIDPGLILHLMGDRKLSHQQISDMLYHQSGLLGVSGISADTRVLLSDPRSAAKLAIDHYVERIAREIGSLIVAAEGVEAIVFSGGVGENAPDIRRRICQKLHYLGLQMDQNANLAHADIVSAKLSTVTVAVMKADEEYIIARDAMKVWSASQRHA